MCVNIRIQSDGSRDRISFAGGSRYGEEQYRKQESIFEKNPDIVRGCNAFDLCDAVRLLTK